MTPPLPLLLLHRENSILHFNRRVLAQAQRDDVLLHEHWTSPQDIKNRYCNASVVGDKRVVFNIKGNDCRLIASVAYDFGALYVKFIGTHKQYDAVDAATVEME